MVDQLAYQLLTKGARVAILAVDPSSPFSGGAVLGDRIRMVHASENATAFIRSMATRGALGGLSRATYDAVQVLDAAGFEYILIETVGVGQAEIDIVRMADTTIVVLVPGMGDSVQAFKAGVLEIADLFVINKADREGVDLLQRDLRLLLSLAEYSSGEWEPPILRTVATSGEGVEKVIEDIQRHVEWLERSGKRREKRINLLRQAIIGQVRDHLQSEILTKHGERLTALATECYEQKRDPYTTALGLIK